MCHIIFFTSAELMVWGLCPSSVVRRLCRNYLRAYWVDCFQISVVASPGPYPQTFFQFLKKNAFSNFWGFFFSFCVNHVNMGPYRSQNFKRLLLLQINFESFQTFSEISSQWSSQKYCFGFFKFWVFDFSGFF